MLNLKKTAVAVLALGSSAVFAGTMGPVCSAVNVTVPCESTAWDFGARALYLKPSIGDAGIVGVDIPAAGVTDFDYRTFQPNYNWGFMIEGSYHFNTGNDVNVNWYHLNNGNNFVFDNSFFFFNDTLPITTGNGGTASVGPNWNTVNLEFGQHVDFGEFKSIRFHGGVSYVRVANDLDITQTANANTATAFAGRIDSLDRDTAYNGFGPRVGADLAYDWGNGLGVYANAAGALYVGNKSFNDTFNRTSLAGVVAATFPNTWSASYTAVVPELEGKVGAKYTYAMAQGDLTFDIGWMWVNYFSAQLNATNTPSVAFATNQPSITSNDFSLEGLYFGLKWLGNVA